MVAYKKAEYFYQSLFDHRQFHASKMVEADADVDCESNGGRIKENWNIVQNNGKRSKVVYSPQNDLLRTTVY